MGCDLQRGQIHAQQLGDPLPPKDVPVLVQDLHGSAWGRADTAGVREGRSQNGGFWGHFELCVRNWGCFFSWGDGPKLCSDPQEGPKVIKVQLIH